MKKLNKPYLTLVTRADWGARKPKNLPQLMVTPVRMMMLFDTQTPECNNVDECIKVVKGLQDEYMDKKGYEDIPWNFLVASDGKVYEGRGWKFKPFKTDLENVTQTEWDGSSVDIAYIGDYRNDYDQNPFGKYPTAKAMHAASKLADHLDRKKIISYFFSGATDYTVDLEAMAID